jgi:hypothetical protein
LGPRVLLVALPAGRKSGGQLASKGASAGCGGGFHSFSCLSLPLFEKRPGGKAVKAPPRARSGCASGPRCFSFRWALARLPRRLRRLGASPLVFCRALFPGSGFGGAAPPSAANPHGSPSASRFFLRGSPSDSRFRLRRQPSAGGLLQELCHVRLMKLA